MLLQFVLLEPTWPGPRAARAGMLYKGTEPRRAARPGFQSSEPESVTRCLFFWSLEAFFVLGDVTGPCHRRSLFF